MNALFDSLAIDRSVTLDDETFSIKRYLAGLNIHVDPRFGGDDAKGMGRCAG